MSTDNKRQYAVLLDYLNVLRQDLIREECRDKLRNVKITKLQEEMQAVQQRMDDYIAGKLALMYMSQGKHLKSCSVTEQNLCR